MQVQPCFTNIGNKKSKGKNNACKPKPDTEVVQNDKGVSDREACQEQASDENSHQDQAIMLSDRKDLVEKEDDFDEDEDFIWSGEDE